MGSTQDSMVAIGPGLAVAVIVLAFAAVAVNRLARTGHATDAAVAVARAVVQLAALAAVIAVVIQNVWASAAFVGVMSVAAAWTSGSRVARRRPQWRVVALLWLPVAAPTVLVVAVLVAVGVLPAAGLAIIPTAGILLGGAMNTTSLAGRRALEELAARSGEVEAALSLGFLPREARSEICTEAGATALLPGIDQTRSVGLVTIPGAFVGMVLGGAPVSHAAIMQLFVMVALLAVSAIAMAVTAEMAARQLV